MDLAAEILKASDRRGAFTSVRWATVAQVSPLLVTFPGDTGSVPTLRLTSYTPILAQSVVLARVGSRWVALGGIA